MNHQFNKGLLEMCVLALIRKKDYYGFELVDTISKYINISDGTIYPLLRRLIEDKNVETYLQESPSGPPRKYYRITKQGKKFTERLIDEWESFHANINKLIHLEVVNE